MRYLNEVRENERLIEHYLCKQKQALVTRAGKTYYSLKVQDKTAVVDAKIWDLHEDIADFSEGEVVKLDAVVVLYQGEVQLKVNRIRRSVEGEYEIGDYIPRTEKDIDALFATLLGFVDSLRQPHLKALLENVVLTHEDALRSHSAAKHMHHSCYGGLLEHTVSVVEICDFMAGRYKFVDRDLLIAGAVLHDLAKIFELTPLPENVYTDEGQLLGHIYMGAEMVARECEKIPGFPPLLVTLLKHMLLAHHGEYEFGSPKLPATLEAFILHAADNMDAKAKVYEEALAADTSGALWLGYHKMLGRYLRRTAY